MEVTCMFRHEDIRRLRMERGTVARDGAQSYMDGCRWQYGQNQKIWEKGRPSQGKEIGHIVRME